MTLFKSLKQSVVFTLSDEVMSLYTVWLHRCFLVVKLWLTRILNISWNIQKTEASGCWAWWGLCLTETKDWDKVESQVLVICCWLMGNKQRLYLTSAEAGNLLLAVDWRTQCIAAWESTRPSRIKPWFLKTFQHRWFCGFSWLSSVWLFEVNKNWPLFCENWFFVCFSFLRQDFSL